MAQQTSKPVKAIDKLDPVWARIREEAEDIVRREPELGTFIYLVDPAPRHAGRPRWSIASPSGSTIRTCRPS